jgi:3-dehydroquinate dehydratase/shikimate dehydrogenase
MLFLSMARADTAQPQGLGLELRLDLFSTDVKTFLRNTSSPVLLTLRTAAQDAEIEQLLALEPPFFDLECDRDPQFLHAMIKKYPKTQFILSYHNFQETPEDLDAIYRSMQEYDAFSYKIAVMAHSTNDALKMLLFAKKHPKVSAICMGEKGSFARVLGPIVGNRVDFACAEEQTAPGQLTVRELLDIYHYPSLNSATAIYGLIGDPVEKSPGHLYHNAVFRERNINAVYVKMQVKPEELSEFIPLAVALGIRGLSVTIPLKEAILPFVDELDRNAQQIGAVNTLLFKNGKILGTNTDGLGALDALEKKISVCGKKIVLLGAGGAARAIAFEAKARGAHVFVLNRTADRARKLAADLGCVAIEEMPYDYDILINCAPAAIDPQKIRPKTVVMDIALQEVYGEEMFLNQAARQTTFWMDT